MEMSLENKELIPIHVHKVMQSKIYTLFILEGGGKKFSIYAEPSVGVEITNHLSENKIQRPKTIDLVNLILLGVEAEPIRGVIYDVNEHIYKAYLIIKKSFEEKESFVQIDIRPSDCLTLSLIRKTPLFFNKEAFNKASFIEDQ
jgi:uncharacterized protein